MIPAEFYNRHDADQAIRMAEEVVALVQDLIGKP